MKDFKAYMMKFKNPFYQAGGTMPPNLDSYVERQADIDLYEGLVQGKFCFLLTSRQMGKSSLAARIVARLRGTGKDNGAAVVMFELPSVGTLDATPERWYFGLLRKIGEGLDQLEISKGLNVLREVEGFWAANSSLGPQQRYNQAIREVILERFKDRQVIIVIDEIEYIQRLPFDTDDFFASMRAFYNSRAIDPELNRLTFCLIGSATRSDLIKNPQITPFNIGQDIRLADFTRREAAPLAKGLGLKEDLAEVILERIFYWTDGQPYLTHKLCESISRAKGTVDASDVDRICKTLFLSHSDINNDDTLNDNLRYVRDRMLGEADRAGLLSLYSQVLKGKRVPNDEAAPLFEILRLSGITKVENGYLKVRNRIYEKVFNRAWIKASMPDAEQRRLRAATLRAWRNAALIISVIAVALIFALYQRAEAINQEEIAQQQKALAETSASEAERQRKIAEASAAEAESQRNIAEERAREATRQQNIALEKAREAQQQRELAQISAAEAERQRTLAQANATEAVRQKRIADENAEVARSEASKAKASEAKALAQQETAEENARLAMVKTKEVEEQRKMAESRALASAAASSVESSVKSKDSSLDSLVAMTNFYYASDQERKISPDLLDSVRTTLVTSKHRATIPADLTGDVAFAEGNGDIVTILNMHGNVASYRFNDAGIGPYKPGMHVLARPKNYFNNVVALSPDGNLAAIGTDEGRISFFDFKSNEAQNNSTIPAKEVKKHRHTINRMALSNPVTIDGKQHQFIASSSQLWASAVSDLRAPNGLILDKAERLWRKPGLVSWAKTLWGTRKNRLVTGFAFSNDGTLVATAREDGTTEIRDTLSGETLLTLLGYRGIEKRQKELVSQKEPSKIQELQNQLGKHPAGHTDAVLDIAFSPDNSRAVTVSRDRTIKVWDISKAAIKDSITKDIGTPECTLYKHKDAVMSVAFSPNGELFATGSQDQTAIVWDANKTHCDGSPSKAGGKALAVLPRHQGHVTTIAFSRDGKSLATASNSTIYTWDVSSADEWRDLSTVLSRIEAIEEKMRLEGKGVTTDGHPASGLGIEELLGKALNLIPNDVIERRCKGKEAQLDCKNLRTLQNRLPRQ